LGIVRHGLYEGKRKIKQHSQHIRIINAHKNTPAHRAGVFFFVGMQEVQPKVTLEDYVRLHKTRNDALERRFMEMMDLAMKCNVKYVIVTNRQMSEKDVAYLRTIPGLTVEDQKLALSRGWKISW
jgi:hypothetical protein